MTTKQAFEQLINRRAWYKPLGYPEPKASGIKHQYKLGKLSTDAIERVLEDAGYRVVQEKLWNNPANR